MTAARLVMAAKPDSNFHALPTSARMYSLTATSPTPTPRRRRARINFHPACIMLTTSWSASGTLRTALALRTINVICPAALKQAVRQIKWPVGRSPNCLSVAPDVWIFSQPGSTHEFNSLVIPFYWHSAYSQRLPNNGICLHPLEHTHYYVEVFQSASWTTAGSLCKCTTVAWNRLQVVS